MKRKHEFWKTWHHGIPELYGNKVTYIQRYESVNRFDQRLMPCTENGLFSNTQLWLLRYPAVLTPEGLTHDPVPSSCDIPCMTDLFAWISYLTIMITVVFGGHGLPWTMQQEGGRNWL